jgi:hypothetical protein
VHCDVGGGYPEADSGLSKLSLEWMIGEAEKAGMLFDGKRVELVLGRAGHGYAPPDANARLHESLTWPWWPAELVPKKHWDKATGETHWRANLFRRRHFSPAPVVDDSAWARGADYRKRLPPDAIKRSSLKTRGGAAGRRPAGGGGT